MKNLIALSGLALMIVSPALAQGLPTGRDPGATGSTVISNPGGSTGSERDLTLSRGGTGADTVETNAAAGSNAGQPSRAVPQGSSGGGESGGGG